MEYRIFPPIGIARIGNSPEFFVGPEVLGSRGRVIGAAGDTEVVDFKDAAHKMKKQAARFHVFERASAADPFVVATLPAGASIKWTVRLANKKDAIVRPASPPASIPQGGLRPTADAARAGRLIDSGSKAVTGTNAAAVVLTGTHVDEMVVLGSLRTDAAGRLLVLGADGLSKSVPGSPIGDSFYNNPNWRDDVADGPVTAEIVFADGHVESAGSAWVIIGPPDFTPASECVTTLYDVVRQVAIGQAWVPNPASTDFTVDIFPMLRRARSLRWSHGRRNLAGTVVSEATWGKVSDDFARQADTSAAEATFRAQQRTHVLAVQTRLSDYTLTTAQRDHLDRWAAGTFTSNWAGVPPVATAATPQSLTQAALDGTAGQGFFPGIEGGRILTDPSIFLVPFDFRIDPTKLAAGDVTALMAQPWQADFLKCQGNWWPSQRPDIAPRGTGNPMKMWSRIGPTESEPDHKQLVDHVMKFGVITPRIENGVEVAIELGRDPAADT